MSVLDIRWSSKQVVYAIFALACASAFMTPVCATNGQTETPEITTVRQFLAGIENHDLGSQLRYVTPDAQAYRLRNGKWIVSQIRDVLISGAQGGGALSVADASKSVSEPIDEIGSKTFDQIATVWTHYQFLVEGKVHHWGHTIYTLIKQDDRWIISSVVDEATTDY
ncbi:MAG: hypothetical protein JO025_24495 [Verrucomicrobia bacterium]|nr:hypothetical protein [Verrucomicrobiota bacterium]